MAQKIRSNYHPGRDVHIDLTPYQFLAMNIADYLKYFHISGCKSCRFWTCQHGKAKYVEAEAQPPIQFQFINFPTKSSKVATMNHYCLMKVKLNTLRSGLLCFAASYSKKKYGSRSKLNIREAGRTISSSSLDQALPPPLFWKNIYCRNYKI